MAKNNAQKRENAEAQVSQLTEDFEDIAPKLQQAEAELTKYEDNLRQLGERLSAENEVLGEKSSLYNEENIRFYQQESRLKSIVQEIEYKEEAHYTKQQAIEKNEVELEENATAIGQLTESTSFNEESLLDMDAEKEQMEAGVNETEKDYYALRGDIDRTEKQGREFQQQRTNADTIIMELQNKLSETKLSLNSVKERLQVEFEVELETILNEATVDEAATSADELRESVNKLKESMQRMGPINPMAMEAYEEIKERYDFITREREDLINAKTSLLETIDELDTVARDTFMDAFHKIKENFMMVFRSLFNEEDDCDLTLSNPDDPLESSVEIIARPKGKKPLTINQLSGGEKTLTAISLLFSIYLLKPAPFCIFDEVDAPLDDANIDKFNTIIKLFSKESQFIIVTLNKRTMASTDIMFGITMVEQVVSKVVPVDLRELV
jgi:chromosome segregation protein